MVLRTGAASLQDRRYRKVIQTLVKAREEAGMTQVEMAQVLGLSQNGVSRIENFDRRLDALEFLLWCEACGVVPGRFLG